ncbi:MAG TPA: class I SAM-dependent methyltransferase [Thermomicrobiales bacterium]|nr:class I SAM-dependent methyltransferase [Thermomicrobiales bacterium]
MDTGDIAPKPAHLGPQYGAQFGDDSIVRAYRHRPPYPIELFGILASLLPSVPGAILDAGCGNGDLTLGMLANLPGIERLDAIDLSAGMIEAGRQRPGGDEPRLRWQVAPLETATLSPPYGLVTAGESMHWMDWEVVLPRFRDALLPGGVLAIVGRGPRPSPWTDDLIRIVQRHSTNRDFQPYDLIDELASRRLFRVLGRKTTAPVICTQTIDDHIEFWHSRNGLSRDRMTTAGAFDREMRALLAGYSHRETVTFDVVGSVTWGLPAPDPGQRENA